MFVYILLKFAEIYYNDPSHRTFNVLINGRVVASNFMFPSVGTPVDAKFLGIVMDGSLAIEFDCYLIDEVISVGDALFWHKCEQELFDKRADRSFIVASHDLRFVRDNCRSALIVEGGRAKWFPDVDVAIDIYCALCEEEVPANPDRLAHA